MNVCKAALLHLYYAGTLPIRNRATARRMASGCMPLVVLFYHRVADAFPNDWTLGTARFAAQMAWLKKHFDLVPLSEAQHRIASGTNRRPTASITFDDGYADNCTHAIPLLLREEIPCTYFVATEYLFGQHPFPHDVAAGHPLQPNTPEQIRALADAGIEIGAHTKTHADLGRIRELSRIQDEILASKDALEDLIQKPIRYFAFPYGFHENLTPEAFQIAREAGFHGVCSAYGGYNLPADDPFHIQRIHGDPEWIRFINWMTFDPRKLHSIVRYDPHGPIPN